MEAIERPMKLRKLNNDVETTAMHVPALEIEVASFKDGNSPANMSNGKKPSGDHHLGLATADLHNNHAEEYDGDIDQPDNKEGDPFPPPEETAPLITHGEDLDGATTMSKSQQKKLRKKKEWEAKREERKAIRKEKIVAKRERRREAGKQAAEKNSPIAKKPTTPKQVQLPITILIDCDFDDLMLDKERISLAAQVTRSYSDNKSSMYRAHLAICSFGGKLRERFDNILSHYKSWRGVRFLDCDFVEATEVAKVWMLDKQGGALAGTFSCLADLDEEAHAQLKGDGEVVYLTSEAEETLTELKPFSTYIIGGLVDKNREKGICYKRATKRGVRTARLPIGEFMDMQSRKVLATNHVNEIMLKWLDCGDWGQAFMQVIPKRKGGKLKVRETEAAQDGRADEVEDDHVAAEVE